MACSDRQEDRVAVLVQGGPLCQGDLKCGTSLVKDFDKLYKRQFLLVSTFTTFAAVVVVVVVVVVLVDWDVCCRSGDRVMLRDGSLFSSL